MSSIQVPVNETHRDQVGLVITRIEEIFESMVDVLAHDGDALSIPYRSRATPPDQPARTLRFPATTVHEATKFSEHSLFLFNADIPPHLTMYRMQLEWFASWSCVARHW